MAKLKKGQSSKQEKKLREENQALQNEVNELKAQISQLADKIEGGKWPPAVPEGFLSPDRKKSIQYLSDEYDDLMSSKTKIMDEMRIVLTRLHGCDRKEVPRNGVGY